MQYNKQYKLTVILEITSCSEKAIKEIAQDILDTFPEVKIEYQETTKEIPHYQQNPYPENKPEEIPIKQEFN